VSTDTQPAAATTDLHSRVREALQERLVLAQTAASATNRATWYEPASGVVSVGDGDLCELIPTDDSRLSRHMVANDPASTIRRAEAGLRTLDRHSPRMVRYTGGMRNVECACGETAPCVEVRELAAGEGIEP